MVCAWSGGATIKECNRPRRGAMVPAVIGQIRIYWYYDLVVDLVYSGQMAQVGIHEAKTHLSRLLRRVAAGEVIVIAKGGTPLARLVPIHSRGRRDLGRDKGTVAIHDDFDKPLPHGTGEP